MRNSTIISNGSCWFMRKQMGMGEGWRHIRYRFRQKSAELEYLGWNHRSYLKRCSVYASTMKIYCNLIL